ncbi:hypothetical protein Vadar_005312 [Vaccinium darrowii]|uniref:Uncharacterized protein n=1 Tax=Vaccinium darrowii TaxID=229202 RepID=A0ACB7YT49_9ERIC|nr:hypothetical protein Vadar_005312 [Vaccinium darrowii]
MKVFVFNSVNCFSIPVRSRSRSLVRRLTSWIIPPPQNLNILLQKNAQDVLDLVDKVQDPEIRRKIIELSLNSTISEAEPSEKPPNNTRYYSINEVFSRLETKSSKPATLQDLQKEVNELKSELRLLKTSQLEQQGSIVSRTYSGGKAIVYKPFVGQRTVSLLKN